MSADLVQAESKSLAVTIQITQCQGVSLTKHSWKAPKEPPIYAHSGIVQMFLGSPWPRPPDSPHDVARLWQVSSLAFLTISGRGDRERDIYIYICQMHIGSKLYAESRSVIHVMLMFAI